MKLADGERKPFLEIAGKMVLAHTCAAFQEAQSIDEIVIVAHPSDLNRVREVAEGREEFAKLSAVVAGGDSRTASVRAGVMASNKSSKIVAIHDAARLLITPDIIDRVLASAALSGAALVAVPVSDTIKESLDGENSTRTLDRTKLWAGQTPQAFRRELILDLLQRAEIDQLVPTDDAALHEHYVGPLPIVSGESTNLKLTTMQDLAIVTAILEARAKA